MQAAGEAVRRQYRFGGINYVLLGAVTQIKTLAMLFFNGILWRAFGILEPVQAVKLRKTLQQLAGSRPETNEAARRCRRPRTLLPQRDGHTSAKNL
jgi:hypothetical protein